MRLGCKQFYRFKIKLHLLYFLNRWNYIHHHQNLLELIYLYFSPSLHQKVVVSVLKVFRCYNNIINRSCGCCYFCLLHFCLLPKPGDRSNFNTHKTCWKCCYNNERPTGQKQRLFDGRTVENKGKIIVVVLCILILHYNMYYFAL